MLNQSLNGKLRSNVRTLPSTLLKEVGHFSLTVRSGDKASEVVDNIYLTGDTWIFAQKNLKKGVIATVYYELKPHEWLNPKTNEVKRDILKFATYIKISKKNHTND